MIFQILSKIYLRILNGKFLSQGSSSLQLYMLKGETANIKFIFNLSKAHSNAGSFLSIKTT